MISVDLTFFAVLILCRVSFFAVPARYRMWVLFVWGVAFYAMNAAQWLPLVVGVTLAAYVLTGRRGVWVLAGLLATLFVGFKLRVDPITQVVMPLGFSFLAFELLHYAVERQRGRLADVTLGNLAAFAFFFPCRPAGPIKRYGQFQEAVAAATPSMEHVYSGSVRILIGLVKKLVMADVLALTAAEAMYADNTAQAWRVVLAYSLQIYLDFSAYSDIAIGSARVLGIVIPENFRWPYLSISIQEFWTRWHISLSSWARDYVFTPLGQRLFTTRIRRSPRLIASLAYVTTFLLIGAWHGLSWNFLVWGAYHGLLLAAYAFYRATVPAAIATSRWFHSWPITQASRVATFLVVTIGWVPFMTDLPRALVLLKLMFGAA